MFQVCRKHQPQLRYFMRKVPIRWKLEVGTFPPLWYYIYIYTFIYIYTYIYIFVFSGLLYIYLVGHYRSLIPSPSYIIVEPALSGSPNVFYPLHPPWFLGLLSCIFPSLHTGVMGLVAAWWRICVNWVLLEINWKNTTSHKYIYIHI